MDPGRYVWRKRFGSRLGEGSKSHQGTGVLGVHDGKDDRLQ